MYLERNTFLFEIHPRACLLVARVTLAVGLPQHPSEKMACVYKEQGYPADRGGKMQVNIRA